MFMSEQINNRCLALLPSGNPHYGKLFQELFSLAIMKAGMMPFRMQESSIEPLPIDVLVQEIVKADAVFADLSENSLDIWLALGCARALKKPICLISSKLEFSLPLDIQDLEIIPYPATPFPSDYAELEQNIIEQLLAKRPQTEPRPATQPSSASSAFPSFIPSSDLSSSADLTSYEVLALTIIDIKAAENGLSPRELGEEMQANECAHLTSHAINSLKQKKLIEKRSVLVTEGTERYSSDNIFITQAGEEWLIRHGKRKNLHRSHSLTIDKLLINR